ncbi:hypothetical protein H4582DRAFT_1960207, partial [Lactarius indigo]
RSSSSQSYVPSRRMSKSPLFLPSLFKTYPSQPHSRQRDRDRDHDLLDIISTKKRRRQGKLIMYVLIPRLPPGVCESGYVLVEQRPSIRQCQTAAKARERNRPSEKKTKHAAKEMAAVMDDDDNKVEEKDKSEIPTLLDHAERILTWRRRHRCWRRPVRVSTNWRRRGAHVLTSTDSASVK